MPSRSHRAHSPTTVPPSRTHLRPTTASVRLTAPDLFGTTTAPATATRAPFAPRRRSPSARLGSPSDMAPDDAPVPPPPKLPEIRTESADDILANAPSTDEIVEAAEPAEDVIASQPGVDELLGRDRDDSPASPPPADDA
jgi:hypothetical protein